MAQCNIIVVENDQHLQKVLQVWHELPHLKAVIQYVGQPKEKYPNVYSVSGCFWEEYLGMSLGGQKVGSVFFNLFIILLLLLFSISYRYVCVFGFYIYIYLYILTHFYYVF